MKLLQLLSFLWYKDLRAAHLMCCSMGQDSGQPWLGTLHCVEAVPAQGTLLPASGSCQEKTKPVSL